MILWPWLHSSYEIGHHWIYYFERQGKHWLLLMDQNGSHLTKLSSFVKIIMFWYYLPFMIAFTKYKISILPFNKTRQLFLRDESYGDLLTIVSAFPVLVTLWNAQTELYPGNLVCCIAIVETIPKQIYQRKPIIHNIVVCSSTRYISSSQCQCSRPRRSIDSTSN